MALIVENGTIVEDANTYVSRADVIAYALARGIVLPDTDATDVMVIKAMDYLSYYEYRWAGVPTNPASQNLAWPRQGVYVGFAHSAVPSDVIPNQLIRAVCELVLHVNAGVELLPTTTAQSAFVKREKIDVIEVEYSEAVAVALLGSLPQMPLVETLLTPLFGSNRGKRVRTVRV